MVLEILGKDNVSILLSGGIFKFRFQTGIHRARLYSNKKIKVYEI